MPLEQPLMALERSITILYARREELNQSNATNAVCLSYDVNDSAPSMLALADYGRNGCVVHNESGVLFVGFGTSVSTSVYSYRLVGNTTLEVSGYIGSLSGIKASGQGRVNVTCLY
jgi:hypothetical protein